METDVLTSVRIDGIHRAGVYDGNPQDLYPEVQCSNTGRSTGFPDWGYLRAKELIENVSRKT
jgi:hypothetical protein